jgi:ankyrin repeat protein
VSTDDVPAFLRLRRAFVDGDLDALRGELGGLDGFPNVIAHPALGWCLVQALYSSPLAFVTQLLDEGADPNLDPGDGFPPLIAAVGCAAGRPGTTARPDVHALVRLLLDRGARTDQRGPNDDTPLHAAAAIGDNGIVDILLAHGADPNATTRIDDVETAYETALAAGHTVVAERLRPLTTRLDWEQATRAGSLVELRRLLERGLDIDATDGYDQTALMRAAHAGETAVLDWLIAHGADLDRTAKFGLSALMLAVIAGRADAARRLVSAGADVSLTGTGAPGFAGKTAAELAHDRGDLRLAAYIRSHRP